MDSLRYSIRSCNGQILAAKDKELVTIGGAMVSCSLSFSLQNYSRFALKGVSQ